MPPKQKRKASARENYGLKQKKQKIVDKDPSVVDSGFQNINHDIAKKLLDNLKLSTYDLKALSETCSSWHVKITTYLREVWVHTLPFTSQSFNKKQKIDTMAAIGKGRKYTSDIQILEFNESVSYQSRMVSISWCPCIIVIVSRDGASILDLRKPDPIVPCPKGTFKHIWGNTMVVTNAKRKQLLLSKRALARKDQQEDCNGPYTHAFCIYNVSEDGKVDLVKQIDTKEEKSPFATYMQDDGSIWVAWLNKIEIYSVSTSKIDTYDYPDRLGSEPHKRVMGFIEHHNTLKIILRGYTGYDEEMGEIDDEEASMVTLLYDTKTRQHDELPVETDYETIYHFTYLNDSLRFLTWHDFTGSCSLEPFIQHQVTSTRDCLVTLSPDGIRLLEYKADFLNVQISLKDKSETRSEDQQKYHSIAKSNVLFFNEELNDEREYEVESVGMKKKRKKKKQQPRPKPAEEFVEIDPSRLIFVWLSNDIIVAAYLNRISILDFRCAAPEEGFKSFELPFLDHSISHVTRISDTSFVIVHATCMVAFKITV